MMSAGSIDRARRLPFWAVAALLMAVAYLLYANTFGASWNFDDFPVIVDNPDVRSWTAFWQNLRPGRPMRELTYLLDRALFGMQPAGWHLQQIFWHGLNAVLLFRLAAVLGAARLVALAAALLFLVHPLQVEVVANLSHRKDSLLLAMALLSLLAYRQLLAAANGRERLLWGAATMVAAGGAWLAKENALMLPGLWVAMELTCVPADQRLLARHPRLLAGLAGLTTAVALIWALFWGNTAYQVGMQGLLVLRIGLTEAPTLGLYLLMLLKSWAFLWLRLVWPFDLALEYTYPPPASLFDPWVLGALVVIGLAAWWQWRCAQRAPLAAFGLLWCAILWLPVSNLWPLTYLAADRYLYAPLAGFCLIVAVVLASLARRYGNAPAIALLAVTVVCLSLLTWQQNRVWATPFSLWSQAVRVSPEASYALNNLGYQYLERGEFAAAKELFERALRNPYNPNPHDNLGWILEKEGDLSGAISHYRQFIRAAELQAQPHYRDRAQFLRRYLQQKYGARVD